MTLSDILVIFVTVVQDVEIVIEPKISAVNQTVAFSVTMVMLKCYHLPNL